MKYKARALGRDTELSLEREGVRIGGRFVDFADVERLTPLNHRVLLDLSGGERIEISMLGFSFDGFWEELTELYAKRSLEALFVEGAPVMSCEGDYQTPAEQGRGRVLLFSDSVCILPPSCAAVRIPLCFTTELRLEGYSLLLATADGGRFRVGRMGYDTQPFAERAQKAADRVKKERAAQLSKLAVQVPFTHKGLFRTGQTGLSWQAGLVSGGCAVELFTGDDAATYLYRFSEPQQTFLTQLETAMEAMGPHREIIWQPDEKIAEKPLWRMAVRRSPAVRFLRARSAGRLIHNASHSERLAEFLQNK